MNVEATLDASSDHLTTPRSFSHLDLQPQPSLVAGHRPRSTYSLRLSLNLPPAKRGFGTALDSSPPARQAASFPTKPTPLRLPRARPSTDSHRVNPTGDRDSNHSDRSSSQIATGA